MQRGGRLEFPGNRGEKVFLSSGESTAPTDYSVTTCQLWRNKVKERKHWFGWAGAAELRVTLGKFWKCFCSSILGFNSTGCLQSLLLSAHQANPAHTLALTAEKRRERRNGNSQREATWPTSHLCPSKTIRSHLRATPGEWRAKAAHPCQREGFGSHSSETSSPW